MQGTINAVELQRAMGLAGLSFSTQACAQARCWALAPCLLPALTPCGGCRALPLQVSNGRLSFTTHRHPPCR